MNPLLELGRFGQSYWLDDLTRPMIESGELQRRVTSEGLTGVTANPAIFRAALHDGRTAMDLHVRHLHRGVHAHSVAASHRWPSRIMEKGAVMTTRTHIAELAYCFGLI